jgi:hypothetical protein
MYAPPRPKDCDIKFLNIPAKDLYENSEYEQIGHLTVWGDTQNAFDEGQLATIRPNACEMGGEAMTLSVSSGYTAIYAVLRKKTGTGAGEPASTGSVAPAGSAAP